MPDDSQDTLYCFTIYDHPADDPEFFVVRKWAIRAGEPHLVPLGITARTRTVEEARAAMPWGLMLFPSVSGKDEPQILETWL